jgi:hypothetical protein
MRDTFRVLPRPMKFVLFCHPPFMRSQSMPRFARMIGEAMQARGHEVAYWAPQPVAHALLGSTRLAKWAGYVDQYLLFPLLVKLRLLRHTQGTLYVFCDQALGPWVPLVKHLPHVVHAHDLLALRSALGQIAQNPTLALGASISVIYVGAFSKGGTSSAYPSAHKRTCWRMVTSSPTAAMWSITA